MAKKHKRLTADELRKFQGFEDFTDERAEEAIEALEKLSILFYELHMKEEQNKMGIEKEDGLDNNS